MKKIIKTVVIALISFSVQAGEWEDIKTSRDDIVGLHLGMTYKQVVATPQHDELLVIGADVQTANLVSVVYGPYPNMKGSVMTKMKLASPEPFPETLDAENPKHFEQITNARLAGLEILFVGDDAKKTYETLKYVCKRKYGNIEDIVVWGEDDSSFVEAHNMNIKLAYSTELGDNFDIIEYCTIQAFHPELQKFVETTELREDSKEFSL